MTRSAEIHRKTTETDITVTLKLDGTGLCECRSGVGFLDHMLTLFAAHGRFDLTVSCQGDVEIDDHHTVEDIGIALGQAFSEAVGAERRGIMRYGSFLLPMDEALVQTTVDISGRAYLSCKLLIPVQKIGSFDTELTEEFFQAFVRAMGITLHLRQLEGRNAHHIVEAAFKCFARALAQATATDSQLGKGVPSTKGMI